MYYYLDSQNQQQGPVAPEALAALGVTAATLVWKDGMPQWTPAGQVAELAALLSQPAPQPQPEAPQSAAQAYQPVEPYQPQQQWQQPQDEATRWEQPADPDEPASMGFMTAISRGYKRSFNFSGRATRAEYWWWWLYTWLLSLLCYIPLLGILFAIISLITIIPSIAVAVRRYHDCGHSGWWFLCPIVNIVFLFFATEDGPNSHGPKPRYA